jgi:hypothetical protein
MVEEHTVKVTFKKDFVDHDDLERFVKDSLSGNRSNSFASEVISIEEVEDE